jgi:predicted nucleic acid-binding protein
MSSTVVIDASAFLRACWGHEEASAWITRVESREVRARAPDLVYAEVANALLLHVRAGLIEIEAAAALCDVLRRLPIRVTPLGDTATPSLRLAAERGLSAYDASYVVVAEQAEAPLLTADERLAGASAESILLA